jgi:hypothetical protein
MGSAGNPSFWKSYAAGIGTGTPAREFEFDLNTPPSRRPITNISYITVVQKQAAKGVSQNSQSVYATTTTSTISENSGTPWSFEGIDDLKQKLAEIDTRRDNYAKQQQKVEDDVSTLTE